VPVSWKMALDGSGQYCGHGNLSGLVSTALSAQRLRGHDVMALKAYAAKTQVPTESLQ
jgi:hypothetical protein